MKILYIVPEDLQGKHHGGVTTYTLVLARALCARGHDISILTPGKRNSVVARGGIHYIQVSTESTIKTLASKLYKKTIGKILPQTTQQLDWAWGILKFIRHSPGFDIIESPDWGNSNLFISLFSSPITVVRLHRSWYYYLKDNHLPITLDAWFLCLLEVLCIVFSQGITSPTHFMANKYRWIINLKRLVNKRCFKVLRNGISRTPIPYQRSGYHQLFILTVGRIEIAKGSDLLLEAFQKVSASIPSVNLILIGEDTDMYIHGRRTSFVSVLKKSINRYNLTYRVKILSRRHKNSWRGITLIVYFT